MIASAARMPSIAAETMPPAYPAPSPAGYSPAQKTLCMSSPRRMRSGALVRVSTAVSTASSRSNPLSCLPNALMTLKEYLEDYASEGTQKKGEAVIKAQWEGIPNPAVKAKAAEYLKELHDGMRDFRF